MFKAIFWDNDGVLMETEQLYYQANAEALARVGVELTLADFCTISLRQGESVLALAGTAEGELRGFRESRYREMLAAEARVLPGVADTLARLHGRLPMAIVTSCRRVNFLEMHARSGLLGFFDFVLTREDYTNSKPDPEPYLAACARAGLAPEDCLAVEDSERGVLSATRAGLTVVAVPGLLNHGCDFTAARWQLTSVGQLPQVAGLG